MNKITLVTDEAGNVIGGSLTSRSERESRADFYQTIVALEGQQVHHDVDLPPDLLSQSDVDALVEELLNHKIDSFGHLVRKG